MIPDLTLPPGVTSAELAAVAHLLRAAYMEAVRVQCGWEADLVRVYDLAQAYAEAARELARKERGDRDEEEL